jgi:hypothetical protein
MVERLGRRGGDVREETGKEVEGRRGAGGGKERGSFERVGWGRGKGEGRKLGRSDSLVGDSCMTGREMSEKTNKPNYGVTDENFHAASNVIK